LKNNTHIFIFFVFLPVFIFSQNNTFSPYSRFGTGELHERVPAHNSGMGAAFIALKPDSTMPVFINTGNPASYALIRLTSLEVGGKYSYSVFKSETSSLKKWSTNFSYGALGFPIGRKGGACFGIMPYSSVGYDTESNAEQTTGTITYKYSGSGGLTKAFLGYGIMPFNGSHTRFRRKHLNVPDSLRTLSHTAFKLGDISTKLLSDFSAGFNAEYIFGNIQNTGRVVYPNLFLYNNTYRERVYTVNGFTGNFGAQTALTFDSISAGNGRKRALKDKVKLTFGYFMSLNNSLNASFNSVAYNYVVNSLGEETIRDTSYYNVDQPGTIKLPLEQGFGIGFKKGERINIVADFALTNWENFKLFGDQQNFKDNYRVAAGINFVPEKYAAGQGAFFRKLHYRLGFSYQTGYINLSNTLISGYFVSAGLGLPVGVGRLSSMVNVSAQYGKTGTTANGLLSENYWRVNFGFTFCDRWFQKFRYD
jgi:hypothetical protein